MQFHLILRKIIRGLLGQLCFLLEGWSFLQLLGAIKVNESELKKNLLDLSYQKYLQFFTTAIIILFTYVVGVIIALFSGQIDAGNGKQLFLVGISSIFFFYFVIIALMQYRRRLEEITGQIRSLGNNH